MIHTLEQGAGAVTGVVGPGGSAKQLRMAASRLGNAREMTCAVIDVRESECRGPLALVALDKAAGEAASPRLRRALCRPEQHTDSSAQPQRCRPERPRQLATGSAEPNVSTRHPETRA